MTLPFQSIPKRWQEPERSIPERVRMELKAYPAPFAQILFNRGITTAAGAEQFLNSENLPLGDPFRMKDMRIAVDRISQAVLRGEQIVIYGDYDVDGVTATVLMVEVLQAIGAKVSQYIPSRYDEGYGLNTDAMSRLKEEGTSLVITVDCGIRSNEEADYARRIGLDLIITDHHHPLEDVPRAVAVICPKQAGDDYPDKDLAGVGVAYKLAQGLAAQPNFSGISLQSYLDLVALGTVADLVDLKGENRILVQKGLRQIRSQKRQGLVSLAGAAEISIGKTTAMDIGFGFGPRLNAAGRLETAQAAYNLLITREASETGWMAQQLNRQNYQRQMETREIQEKAAQLAVPTGAISSIIFAIDENFKSGLVGLAASRLVDTYYRPAVVGQREADTTRCSCRSIPEFHITDALDQCSDLLIRHGGHAAAAGFTVSNEKLEALIRKLTRIADDQLGGKDLRPTLVADASVDLVELDSELFGCLEQLQPTGYGNREPLFLVRRAKILNKRLVGAEGTHLKMTLSSARGVVMDAIGFRLGDRVEELPEWVDVLSTFERNEYKNHSSFQLNVKDIRPAANG